MGMSHPPLNVEYAEDYKTINVNGVFGGHRPGYFEFVVYTDEGDAEKSLAEFPPDPKKIVIKRTIHARMIMDLVQAKSFSKWLNNHISRYERQFGAIPDIGKEGKGPPPGLIA